MSIWQIYFCVLNIFEWLGWHSGKMSASWEGFIEQNREENWWNCLNWWRKKEIVTDSREKQIQCTMHMHNTEIWNGVGGIIVCEAQESRKNVAVCNRNVD